MFSEYIKKSESEGKEKHTPFILVSGCSSCGEMGVIVKVGKEIYHPSTVEHYIGYIELFGITKDDKLVLLTRFELSKENTIPYVKTHIKNDLYKKLIALSYCNLHGLWESEIEI